jgi:nitroimidazol reductase NimA-like FMN-containing flavoprotein (pyridoxamine 5'-phosphate oxidase superfamily)
LRRNRIGRLGVASQDRPYVVPIAYAYEGGCIYGYSSLGRKVCTMREQPMVCFEVDEIESGSSWRSVVAEGEYEELTNGPERARALDRLTSGTGGPVPRTLTGLSAHPIIVFRIRVRVAAGRFERRDA